MTKIRADRICESRKLCIEHQRQPSWSTGQEVNVPCSKAAVCRSRRKTITIIVEEEEVTSRRCRRCDCRRQVVALSPAVASACFSTSATRWLHSKHSPSITMSLPATSSTGDVLKVTSPFYAPGDLYVDNGRSSRLCWRRKRNNFPGTVNLIPVSVRFSRCASVATNWSQFISVLSESTCSDMAVSSQSTVDRSRLTAARGAAATQSRRSCCCCGWRRRYQVSGADERMAVPAMIRRVDTVIDQRRHVRPSVRPSVDARRPEFQMALIVGRCGSTERQRSGRLDRSTAQDVRFTAPRALARRCEPISTSILAPHLYRKYVALRCQALASWIRTRGILQWI